MESEYRQPLDLAKDPLFVFVLLRLADHLSYFYLRSHHLVLDGYGAANAVRHIAAVYSGGLAPSTESIDFSDLGLIRDADRKYLQSSRFESDAAYWKALAPNYAESIGLSGPHRSVTPRHPAVRRIFSGNGDSRPEGRFDVAKAIASVAIFLARSTGRSDVTLSLPVSGRTTAALRRPTWMLSNMVPLPISVDDESTFGELTEEVLRALVGALRHQQYRDWPIVLESGRDDTNIEFGPIVNVLDFFEPIQFGPSTVTWNILTTGPLQDFAINIYPQLTSGEPVLEFSWNPERYSTDEIDRHIQRFDFLLSQLVVVDPSVVVGDVVLADERQRELVAGWGGWVVRCVGVGSGGLGVVGCGGGVLARWCCGGGVFGVVVVSAA